MLDWASGHQRLPSKDRTSVGSRLELILHSLYVRKANSRTHIDKKCPFTGMVSIRGRILTGTVVSTKMHRTLIIRREYLHFVPKYARYEKRHKNLAAHVSPCFRVEEGDQVTVGQCRPLSKTVSVGSFAVEKWGKDYKIDVLMRWCETGSIQCSARASTNWQGGQGVFQVLGIDGEHTLRGGTDCWHQKVTSMSDGQDHCHSDIYRKQAFPNGCHEAWCIGAYIGLQKT